MHLHPFPTSLLCLLGVVLSACSQAREPGNETLGVMRPDATFPAARSGIREARREVIRSREAWQAFWEAHRGAEEAGAPPEVDFADHMVVAVTLGERSTGGYTVRIRSVVAGDGGVEVLAVERAPGPGCMTTQALTQPVDAVVVRRAEGPVRFRVETEERSCG